MNTKPIALGLLGAAVLAGIAAGEELKATLSPPGFANSLQYGYSQATVVAADARLIHVAGQVGISDDGPNDVGNQAKIGRRTVGCVVAVAGIVVTGLQRDVAIDCVTEPKRPASVVSIDLVVRCDSRNIGVDYSRFDVPAIGDSGAGPVQ